MEAVRRALDRFRTRYGSDPDFICRAPGRVNLIGDHTDYNDGFVLPMALSLQAVIAGRARSDSLVDCEAADLEEEVWFDAAAPPTASGVWSDYVAGVAWSLGEDRLSLRGWDGVIASDVPRGSGLSSSAALELAVARTFATTGNHTWEPVAMALACQRAENEWVGVNCGIMDQLASAAAEAGSALMIDCRTLDHYTVRLPDDIVVVVLDTGTRRGLVDSAYNERRAACQTASETLGLRALRDADLAGLDAARADLGETVYRRARHVVTENQRVLEAADATNDPRRFGRLMFESHASLRDDFEVSAPALDTMVEIAAAEGCFGARLTGAGFAGAAVALVAAAEVDRFVGAVDARYRAATGHDPWIFPTQAGAGALSVAFGGAPAT